MATTAPKDNTAKPKKVYIPIKGGNLKASEPFKWTPPGETVEKQFSASIKVDGLSRFPFALTAELIDTIIKAEKNNADFRAILDLMRKQEASR